jgi:hypothetical protein
MVDAYDSSIVKITNCEGIYLGAFNHSSVTVQNSTSIIECVVSLDSSKVWIIDSAVGSNYGVIYCWNSATIWLINASTYDSPIVNISDNAAIYVEWYLKVHVIDSIGQNVPFANVTAICHDTTVAESGLTDSNGQARLTLIEKVINATGSYSFGNYTVTVKYDLHTQQQSVNMTGNQEITIQLSFIIPEFRLSLILPIFKMAISVAITYKRKNHQKWLN